MKGDLVCVLSTLKSSVEAMKEMITIDNSTMVHHDVKSETLRAYKDGQCAALHVVLSMIRQIEEDLCLEEE